MKRGWGWPLGVTAILAATVGVNIWIAVVAGDDPSFAIEPDYYHKAVTWDSTLAQANVNARLGWHLEPTLAGFNDKGADLAVRLVDATGTPIDDAVVRVSALFNARADKVYEATLVRGASAYSARLPVAHAGQWELRFDVTRGAVHFTSTSRIEAVAAGS